MWCRSSICFNRWSILKDRFTIYKQQEKKVTFRFYVKISIDKIQIDRAYEAGADIILLIVAALTKEKRAV